MFRALLTAYFLALAGVYDLSGVDRIAINLFLYNFSVFANEKVHPAGGFRLVDVETVFTGYLSAPIAQQREGYSDRIGEGFVGVRAVHAHTQDLGVGRFQLFQILLEGLHLRRSTTGEGKDVEGQHDILLALIFA